MAAGMDTTEGTPAGGHPVLAALASVPDALMAKRYPGLLRH